MKLNVDDVSIDFFNFNTQNLKIGIAVSGGADSALLLYLTAKYIKNAEIIPWSGHEIENKHRGDRPFTIYDAKNVVHVVRNKLPDANISEHYIWTYDRQGQNKKIYMIDEVKRCLENGTIDLYVSGKTANPPKEVLHKIINKLPAARRTTHIDASRNHYQTERPSDTYYAPFTNINKQVISKLYQKYDCMKDLFPVTQSCVGYAEETNWFTEPCKQCFWCHERKWAFGCYDNEKKL